MALTEEQKRQAREAGAKNAEAIRNREYANPEVQARDEASRVRVVTSDGVKKPSEILSQFGSLNYLFGADQAQHQADLLAHRERMTPALQRFQTAAAGANKLYQDHLKLKPMAISGWTGEYQNAGYADQIHTDHPNLHPTEFRENQNDQTRAWAEKERALRQQAIDYTELSNALTYEELMRNIDFYADLAEQRYQEYIHSEDYVTRTRAHARERDERMRMATALGADPAYMGLFNWESKDEREEELRAIAAYYRNLADAQKDEQLMTADMEELSQWTDTERLVLAQFATEAYREYLADPNQLHFQPADDEVQMLFEKYGETRVRELAESYLRFQNQQYAQSIIQDTQNLGLPEQDLEAEFKYNPEPTPEDVAMNNDLRELARWSPSEQSLLVQYAADPEGAEDKYQILAAKYGKDVVNRIAESYTRSLQMQQPEQAPIEEPEKRNGWSMAGHSAASVGANLIGSMTGPAGYLTELMTRTGRYSTMDPYNAGMLPGTYAGTVRQTVSEELMGRNHGMAKAVLYQAGMSALDNLARIIVGGKVGSLALAATGSFGSAVQEYSQQGTDPVRAVAMGVLRGAVEVITEKVSLDNLLKEAATPKGLEEMLRSIFLGGGIEVTEEEFGLVLTTFLEAGILREESSFNRRVAELQTYGLNREQAREQACYGLLEEALNTGIQSFLSGGMMTGAVDVYANVTGGTQPKTASRGTPVVYPDNVEVKQDLLDSAERISKATGRNIVFYSSENTAEDGFYDPDTGAIHINVKGVDPMAQIFGHELTHSIESSAMYQQLSNLVMHRIRQTGGNLEQLRAAKMDLYKRNGQTLPDQTAVDREIVASYVASHLLTNEQEITSLVQEQPSVGKRILNWLNDLLAKWGNKNAQERQFIRRARDYYARALDQSQRKGNVSNSGTTLAGQQSAGTVTNPGTAATASPAGQTVPNSGTSAAPAAQTQQEQQPSPQEESPEDTDRRMQEQYRTGAITEEQYDAYLDERDQYDQQRGVDPMDREEQRFYGEQGRQYSFAESDASQNVETDVSTKYHGIDLSNESHIYSYEFLTGLPDMKTVIVAEISDIRNENKRVDTAAVVKLGKENALSVGEERDGKIYVKNKYTGRELQVTTDSIRHGLNGEMNRLLTNARMGAVIGDVVQNAVPINALHNKAADVDGTYAMAGYAQDSDGREFVVIITVEQRNNQMSGFEVYDLIHAISGRQKRGGVPVDTKSQGINLSTYASEISIKDFLEVVKDVYQSVLSEDVLAHLGRQRPSGGYYSDRVKFSIPENTPNQEQELKNVEAKELTRNDLNTKASNRLRSAEWKLLNDIGQALYVPYHAKRDTLKPMIQEMTDEYLRTGQISEETKTRIFEAAYEAGIGIDQEFVEQYKDITPPLRTTAITVSQEERADIPNYAKIRNDANTNRLLRITEDGGRSLGDFYQEMQRKAPDLFPAELTHPADQLQKLFEVSRDIAISENFLIDSRGPQEAAFKAGARRIFDNQLADSMAELNNVRRYGEEKLFSRDDAKPISIKEAEDIGHKLKNARRNYEKVNAKHLLTAHDEMQVGRLLRGETQLEYLQNEENFESIKAVFEAKQEYEHYAQLLAQYKRQVRKAKLDLADKYLATANTWKDKKAGILYSRETMRRNIFDIIPDDPKLAEAIVEEYFEPIHKSEAANTRFKQEYRDRVKALGLSRKVNKGDLVSEAHAVQLLGEAADNIRVIENSRGRVKTRDGKTLLEWQAVVQNLWAENPSLDKTRIENAVLEFRKIYDELFRKMNQTRLANGYEPVSYRQGYFPHFQPGDGDGIMHYFGKILGIDVSVDNLPTTINGLTHTFKPGITWMGNAQERLGFNTAYDAVEGFDKYIEGVSSVIHHTENIQKLRALATQARYRTSDEGIREQVDAIQRDTRLTDEERQLKIQDIYEHGRFALSNFVVELDEYTNLLANKKSKYDRSMEHLLGRKWYTIMKRVESWVGANMIAGNISSAFTNFIPLTQAMGHFGLIDMAKGARGTLQAIFHKDKSIVGQSDFLTNRRGGDVLVKAWADKLSDVLGTPMELIDSIVSETIVRAAYSQNLRRGLSESEAMHQADIAAAGIMADRSKGALPTLFESSNPLIKLFTQFQVEVNNQYSEIFKDMPREYRDRAKIVLAFAFFKYFLAAFLWNELEEKLMGRRSALDPVDMAGNFYSDWKEAGAAEAIGNLSVNLIEGLPFTSALAFLGLDIDGGRIPVASAIPDVPAVFNALLGRDIPKNVRMRTLGQELQKPITYLLMPAGGGQVAKAWKGIQAYREGGSYSLNQDGEEILQYPIYKDAPQESAVNLVKSILFGKSSLSTAQDWVDNDFDSLSAEETAIYQDLMECGSNPREAYEALRRVQAVPKEDPELVENAADVRRQNQTNIILNDDLSPEAQSILFYGLVATENEQKLMDQMVEAGSGYEGLVKFVSSFYDIKLWEEDDKKGAYRDLLASSGLTEEEKIVAVGEILGTEETTETGNLSDYGKFKLAVEDGMSVDNFMKIYAAGASMDTYFDFSDTGIQQDDAVNLVLEMSELKPLPGAKSVSWYQKCDVILGSRLTAAEQVRALQVVCNETTGAKIRIGYDNGLPPGALIWLKQLLPDFDANNNGSYAQREVTAAIDAVSGDDNLIYTMTGTSPHGFRLTNEQKAVLWQLQTGAKDGKSNPYDREIGKLIYDLVQADKEARG